MMTACTPKPEPEDKAATVISSPANPAFINKVWKVVASDSVQVDQLYVFLSDGTLLITSRNSTPLLARWENRDGTLLMIEDGISYQTDILSLSRDELKIRSHNAGGSTTITLQSAEQPRPHSLGMQTAP